MYEMIEKREGKKARSIRIGYHISESSLAPIQRFRRSNIINRSNPTIDLSGSGIVDEIESFPKKVFYWKALSGEVKLQLLPRLKEVTKGFYGIIDDSRRVDICVYDGDITDFNNDVETNAVYILNNSEEIKVVNISPSQQYMRDYWVDLGNAPKFSEYMYNSTGISLHVHYSPYSQMFDAMHYKERSLGRKKDRYYAWLNDDRRIKEILRGENEMKIKRQTYQMEYDAIKKSARNETEKTGLYRALRIVS